MPKFDFDSFNAYDFYAFACVSCEVTFSLVDNKNIQTVNKRSTSNINSKVVKMDTKNIHNKYETIRMTPKASRNMEKLKHCINSTKYELERIKMQVFPVHSLFPF